MVQLIKDFANFLSAPAIFFSIFVVGWWAMMKWYKVWTQPKFILTAFYLSLAALIFGLTDSHFFKEATKPDNIPIWFLMYGVGFFFWLSMRRGSINDELAEKGEPNLEQQAEGKVYTWPDLVFSEFICAIIFTAFLLAWANIVPSPLEDPANAGITPAIAKAPWYFLGLQEILVYYDPWIAGVVLPGMIVMGLIAQPYFDVNPKGNGYYTVKERYWAIWGWGFGFVVLWISLIFLGTFMRGPGWMFFGIFEVWDSHKIEAMVNINLSEIIWVKLLNVGLPSNILIREAFGIVIVVAYLGLLPPLLAATKLNKLYEKLGFLRYQLFITLALVMFSLPVKMYLRWLFDLKYIVSIPEFLFNI